MYQNCVCESVAPSKEKRERDTIKGKWDWIYYSVIVLYQKERASNLRLALLLSPVRLKFTEQRRSEREDEQKIRQKSKARNGNACPRRRKKEGKKTLNLESCLLALSFFLAIIISDR